VTAQPIDGGVRAWLAVIACFLVALFAWGFGFYGHGTYLAELQRIHPWSTASISAFVTAHYVLGAALLIAAPRAIARFGMRAVMSFCLIETAAAVVAIPHVTALWQLAIIYAGLALGWAGTSMTAIAIAMSARFQQRRGLALNLALSGATLSGIVVAPLLLLAIETWGFAGGIRVSLAVMLTLALPAVLLFLGGPSAGSGTADAVAPTAAIGGAQSASLVQRRLLSTWAFWSIAAPFALAMIAQVGFITHIVPYLRGHASGVDPALALAVLASAALAGRVGLGFFVDRWDQRKAAAISFGIQGLAFAGLLSTSEPRLVLAAFVLFGLAVGNNITYPALIVQREFSEAQFAKTLAVVTATVQLSYAFGPGVLGLVRDAFGGYAASVAFCLACDALAASVILARSHRRS
jgi:MFS family permease